MYNVHVRMTVRTCVHVPTYMLQYTITVCTVRSFLKYVNFAVLVFVQSFGGLIGVEVSPASPADLVFTFKTRTNAERVRTCTCTYV